MARQAICTMTQARTADGATCQRGSNSFVRLTGAAARLEFGRRRRARGGEADGECDFDTGDLSLVSPPAREFANPSAITGWRSRSAPPLGLSAFLRAG